MNTMGKTATTIITSIIIITRAVAASFSSSRQ
jgi:hypothetical protein